MDYEQLMEEKMRQLQMNVPSRAESITSEEIRPETPSFTGDRMSALKNKQPIEQEQKSIIIDWDALSDLVEERPYNQQDLNELFQKLYIRADLWKFLCLLAYDEHTNAESMQFSDLRKVLGILFDSVQNLTPELKVLIEDQLQYRSLAHLNRVLFSLKMPSFEKTIKLVSKDILEHTNTNIFTISKKEPIITHTLSFAQFQVQQKEQQTNKGNLRSQKLYEHAMHKQDKLKHFELLKTKKEIEEVQKYQSQKKSYTSNEIVFQRLSNVQPKIQKAPEQNSDPECTFQPKINKELNIVDKNLEQIPGFENAIKCKNKAKQEKEYVEKFFENKQSKLRETNKTATPIKLSQSEHSEVLMFLDVKVSKNKTGRLGVRVTDDHDELVENFAKTFQLSLDQKTKLRESLRQAISQLQG